MKLEDKYKDFLKKDETLRSFILKLVMEKNKGKKLTKVLHRMEKEDKMYKLTIKFKNGVEAEYLTDTNYLMVDTSDGGIITHYCGNDRKAFFQKEDVLFLTLEKAEE
jgi:hypothetical protein